ncbi:response regulator transcription factor [Paludifilum halophilum]|uniref:DNA-binding response regulator n=1 Tax=Paludifilum halophilum TaxID=1642702 RepID=A0A235B3T0_9BACL|nr:response regulator transcription factor [Paludifilum halophilum]OYD06923.1 DNA-binding response regulator [Paludifilum halophilum]
MNARLLLVDDESAILDLLKAVLEKEGFRELETAQTGEEAVQKCRRFSPDLILLDVMLPDLEGFEVCRQMREVTPAPILFLTARSNDLDKLMGLGIGGDDYITKPFNPLEVAARVKAQLRRQRMAGNGWKREPECRVYDYGRFQVDEDSGQLVVQGQKVPCPAREFQLLAFLCRHPNRIFSKGQLYEQVWGEESFGDDNTVMVHIRRLREKIEENPGHPRFLQTVRGLGYKLVKDGEEIRP